MTKRVSVVQREFSPTSNAGAGAEVPLHSAMVSRIESELARCGGWMLAIVLIALGFGPAPLAAQLRPYEPTEWTVFDGDTRLVARVGGSVLDGQRASLAGETGTLKELGLFSVFARSGRIAIGAEGTFQRRFERTDAFANPQGGAEADADGTRIDAGDYRISTVMRLTPDSRNALAVLRFGTRLPTTDNAVGLERDQMDFFVVVGGRYDLGAVRATAEAGLGIHGTRDPIYEQSDVVIYHLSIGLPRGIVAPSLVLTGHADGLPDRSVPGNEELAEVRFRVRAGRSVWVQAEAIAGLMEYSPDRGLSIMVGAAL